LDTGGGSWTRTNRSARIAPRLAAALLLDSPAVLTIVSDGSGPEARAPAGHRRAARAVGARASRPLFLTLALHHHLGSPPRGRGSWTRTNRSARIAPRLAAALLLDSPAVLTIVSDGSGPEARAPAGHAILDTHERPRATRPPPSALPDRSPLPGVRSSQAPCRRRRGRPETPCPASGTPHESVGGADVCLPPSPLTPGRSRVSSSFSFLTPCAVSPASVPTRLTHKPCSKGWPARRAC